MYCNHCGASNPDGAVFCNACGKPISGTDITPDKKTVTDNSQSGLQARSQWCDFLRRFRSHVLQAGSCYDKIGEICQTIRNLEAEKAGYQIRLDNDKAHRRAVFFFIVWSAFDLLMLYSAMFLYPHEGTVDLIGSFIGAMIGIIIVSAPAILILAWTSYRRKKWQKEVDLYDRNIDLQLKKAEKEKLKLQISFEGFEENKAHGVYIVGFKYSNPWMLKALEDVIRDGKADTPKEAIACYETEQERRKNQQERDRNAIFQQSLLARMDELGDQMAYLGSIATADFIMNGIGRR